MVQKKMVEVADATIKYQNGQSVTFIYVDATKGWINVQNAEDTETGKGFVTATGGTESTSGNYKIHTFTGPGTFTVSAAGNLQVQIKVDYLVVAGGGGGGGGKEVVVVVLVVLEKSNHMIEDTYTASPLNAAGLPSTSYSTAKVIQLQLVEVEQEHGPGGIQQKPGVVIQFSIFNNNISWWWWRWLIIPRSAGAWWIRWWWWRMEQVDNFNWSRRTGNTPPVSPPQGNPGEHGGSGPGWWTGGGGGGGAGAAGGKFTRSRTTEVVVEVGTTTK